MSENQALDKQALLQQIANLPTTLAGAVREIQEARAVEAGHRSADQPQSAALSTSAQPQGLKWVLGNYRTVAEAYAR